MYRRRFLQGLLCFISTWVFSRNPVKHVVASTSTETSTGSNGNAKFPVEGYDPAKHKYAMGIDVDKCIGCNRCVEACTVENDVPPEPFFTRTWVERYLWGQRFPQKMALC
jgi:NAD-dependent dihydropyrimidine dehydrogenase PreA subunit